MKTFKTFCASFALIFLGLFPISAMGQSLPHTFTANTPSTASEVNANFKYLLDRIGGIRETTVNCGTNGSGINAAIQSGYNSIIINGICKENIKLDGTEGNTPRLLKLRGANNNASLDKIIDNSSYTDYVIKAWYSGMLLSIDNLTISGGERGISTWSNINLKIYNSKVDDYKEKGVHLGGGSVMDAENLTIDGSNSSASSSETGLELWGSSMAYTRNLTITNNQRHGIATYISHIELDGNVSLTGNTKTINVGHNASLSSRATVTITGTNSTSDEAIEVNQGVFHAHDGSINVTSAPMAFHAWMSNVFIRNFTGVGNGSLDRDVMVFSYSTGAIENVILSNGGNSGLGVHNSNLEIDNLTSSNNQRDGISASRSKMEVRDSVFSGNDDGIDIDEGSSLYIRSSNISSNSDDGIEIEGNSVAKIRDSTTIASNSDNGIKVAQGSLVEIEDSTVSGVSGKNAIVGYNNAILILDESSNGTTLISTTNADAISLRNSDGEIRDGVVVSGTGSSNYPSGIALYQGSYIKIEGGATVTGTQDSGSIVGNLHSTIEIEHGSTISHDVWCGMDNTTMVTLLSNNGNYSPATMGNNCRTSRL